jgi:isopenicillin N synthase-like dioxygenase
MLFFCSASNVITSSTINFEEKQNDERSGPETQSGQIVLQKSVQNVLKCLRIEFHLEKDEFFEGFSKAMANLRLLDYFFVRNAAKFSPIWSHCRE